MKGAITTAGSWGEAAGVLQGLLQLPRRLLALGKGVEVVVVAATPQVAVEGVEEGVPLAAQAQGAEADAAADHAVQAAWTQNERIRGVGEGKKGKEGKEGKGWESGFLVEHDNQGGIKKGTARGLEGAQ
jgi:hypothetical protein